MTKPTYLILQTLPEGNNALVHLAYNEVLDKQVVQKTISMLGLADAVAHAEPRLLDRLEHKHLVQVSDAQWDPDNVAIAGVTFIMPYYEGGSVQGNLMKGYNFSVGEAVRIAAQVLDALDYLHTEKRILHRDLKVSNVFLSTDKKTAYLGDLGSAAEMDQNGKTEARSGTALYRPPECSDGHYGVPGEIYGVGMMLLEMLNGRYPYEDIDASQVLKRNTEGTRSLPKKYFEPGVHVPGPLCRLIRQMVNINPSMRPKSAAAAKRSLQGIPHLNWRLSDSGEHEFDHVWTGEKRNEKTGKLRFYEVRARKPENAPPRIGQFEVSARWRNGESEVWRGMPALGIRSTETGSQEWRKIFKSVSDLAHRWAAK
ncbi:serine/threonine-protein kinase [Amycolatopsis sp. NPDC051903]|uniref:serine/threonine-protein kinase n=1 Tax=Amycolatopsis sp. NPDC051903 TaxID=3363936 RepID=UPI0037904DB8